MIIESENGSVSSVDLINIGMDLIKKISAQAAQVDMFDNVRNFGRYYKFGRYDCLVKFLT